MNMQEKKIKIVSGPTDEIVEFAYIGEERPENFTCFLRWKEMTMYSDSFPHSHGTWWITGPDGWLICDLLEATCVS